MKYLDSKDCDRLCQMFERLRKKHGFGKRMEESEKKGYKFLKLMRF